MFGLAGVVWLVAFAAAVKLRAYLAYLAMCEEYEEESDFRRSAENQRRGIENQPILFVERDVDEDPKRTYTAFTGEVLTQRVLVNKKLVVINYYDGEYATPFINGPVPIRNRSGDAIRGYGDYDDAFSSVRSQIAEKKYDMELSLWGDCEML